MILLAIFISHSSSVRWDLWFLWIPLTEDPGNAEQSGQSDESSRSSSKDNDQPESSAEKTPAIHVDLVRPSDPPRRGSFTKSKRKIKAQQKRDRKRDNLARKCKNFVQPSNTPLNDDTMDNSNRLTDDLLHDERSLTDMLASALRDTPSGSQTVTVTDNGTPQSCIDESSLSQVISLESQLVVSRIENESASNEITRLKTVIELLEEEISCYKKTSTYQKQEIKSLKSTNDNLRRELSHFRGMRRFATSSVETRDKTRI